MTKFVGTSLRGFDFASPSSEALSARVSSDNTPRIRIDAGGRITWGPGNAAGDTNLYRSEENVLTTDDLFRATGGLVTITSDGAPNYAIPDGGLAVDVTNDRFFFRTGGEWKQVIGGGGTQILIQATAPIGEEEGTLWLDTDTLVLSIFYNDAWVNVTGGGSGDGMLVPNIDGGNQLVNDIFEAEISNWPIAIYNGGEE